MCVIGFVRRVGSSTAAQNSSQRSSSVLKLGLLFYNYHNLFSVFVVSAFSLLSIHVVLHNICSIKVPITRLVYDDILVPML